MVERTVQNETAMKEMYGGFATWLNKYGRNIIGAKKLTKSLHSVISTWVHDKKKQAVREPTV